MKRDWFEIENVHEKIRELPTAIGRALGRTERQSSFTLGRDVKVVAPADLPSKPGLSSKEGQARLLHDLASIELQAMELGLRTLAEFPDAPREFRQQLADVTESEGRHLSLCLRAMESLGYEWGHWNVHLSLWNVVAPADTLLDRILIVHRYLEGSGLDAGESILRRLTGADKATAPAVKECVGVIVNEEVGHVLFGSVWYRKIAELLKIDPERDFAERIGQIALMAPRREKVARELRVRAGFTFAEIAELEKHVIQRRAHGSESNKQC